MMGDINIKKLFKRLSPDPRTFLAVSTLRLLARETILTDLRSHVRKFVTGSREKIPHREIPEVEGYADEIMEILRYKGRSPRTVAIDGLPGSGKSTLGRSLANRAGLKWRTLHRQELVLPYPFKEGRIYENMRLIRTQDVEHFDMVIYLNCRPEVAKQRILARDRDGMVLDMLRFDMVKEIGDLAFSLLDGEELTIQDSPVRVKLRPESGYSDMEKLRTRLCMTEFVTDGFSKEELLFALLYGTPEGGITPYLKLGAYNEDFSAALSAALGRRRGFDS
jgi:hypothetical protein